MRRVIPGAEATWHKRHSAPIVVAGPGPAPAACSPAVSRKFSRQRRANTRPEIDLRRALYRLGLRYRVDRRAVPNVRRKADIVFSRARVAVFVDGCFWHGCPEHGTWPRTNADWWRRKIEGNRRRDKDTDAQLRECGWISVRVWEHERAADAASMIAALVKRRRSEVR